ncbi:Aminopeptidases of the M20 family [Phaffia rhodozyma]|uniref:Peptide hydrolase n=1 Tax=Phaffia rhodozyma TaxID=264483 RepID=A0A0F7ST21_PHARH|nr:Aminopeptidases of the M20 family [Phaffia rhodozyma]
MRSRRTNTWGPLPSLVVLIPVVSVLTYLTANRLSRLPAPLAEGTNSITNEPQFSESLAISHIQALEDSGWRIVGTDEHVKGRDYVWNQVKVLKEKCDQVQGLDCEVDLQRGNGNHRFNILDHDVLKTYTGLTNVILRISNGSSESKESALLLNSHIDSQLPGPGAADDAIGVGIMLEIARILIERERSFTNSVVFLFNNAEESLQGVKSINVDASYPSQASHLFSTQHPMAKTIKAVVNLEAAGTTGQEMLFQATNNAMVKAYSKVPHPHGSVLAADIFSSGIIGSDTDFGQFEEYLNIGGLDMAVVDNSWYYHTSKDTIANLEKGTTQHFGENVLAVVDELTAPESSLAEIEKGVKEQDLVYLSFFDSYFLMYSLETSSKISAVLISLVALLVLNRSEWRSYKAYAAGIAGCVSSFIGALLGVNIVALLMSKVLDRSMSWYSHELLPLALYAPPAFAGIWISQSLTSRFVPLVDAPLLEHASQTGVVVLNASIMAALTYFRIRSACLFALLTAAGVITLSTSEILTQVRRKTKGSIHLAVYVVAQLGPIVSGTDCTRTVLGIFVPLTGRMGVIPPVELIIANITGVFCFLFASSIIPLYHRFGPAFQKRVVLFAVIASAVSVGFFSFKRPFSDTAPRRVFFQHEFNATSGDFRFHIAMMDSAPGYTEIFDEVHSILDLPAESKLQSVSFEERDLNPTWDALYPVQHFFAPFYYKISPPEETGRLPTLEITVVEDTYEKSTDIRSIKLKMDHPGLIWPVIAFSAKIKSWPFNTPPPQEYIRHHLKSASEKSYESYSIEFKVFGNEPIEIDYVGIVENGMHPATAPSRGSDIPGAARLEKVWNYMFDEKKGVIEPLCHTTVVGRVVV